MSVIARPVFNLGLRQILRTKKFMFAVLVSLLPLLAGAIMLVADLLESGQSHRFYQYQFYPGYTEMVQFFVLAGTVPFVALLLAGGMMADEVEDRTLSYLLARPVRRAHLYWSKFLPVALIAGGLAMAQALLLALMRLLAYVIVAPERPLEIYNDFGVVVDEINQASLILRVMPVAMLCAAAYAILLCAVFGVLTLIVPRFHFFANLIVYLVWELPLGFQAGGGLGYASGLFHVNSLIVATDPTYYELAVTSPAWLAPWMLLLGIAAWTWLGGYVTSRKDFNVSSAAS